MPHVAAMVSGVLWVHALKAGLVGFPLLNTQLAELLAPLINGLKA